MITISSSLGAWQQATFGVYPSESGFPFYEEITAAEAEQGFHAQAGSTLYETGQNIPGWYMAPDLRDHDQQGSGFPGGRDGSFNPSASHPRTYRGYRFREWQQPESGLASNDGETRFFYGTSENRREYRFRRKPGEGRESVSRRYQGWNRSPYKFRPTSEISSLSPSSDVKVKNPLFPRFSAEQHLPGNQDAGWYSPPVFPYLNGYGGYLPLEFNDPILGFED